VKKVSGKIVNHDKVFNGTIEFSKNINSISEEKNFEIDNIIIPGFIDLHCHGGNGFDTMGGLESIKKLSKYHLLNGTTAMLPTTLTATLNDTRKALIGLNDLIKKNKYTTNIIGTHLEGPFINSDKLGAQPPFAQLPNIDFIKEIQKIALIRIVTLAPELKDSEKLIDYLINNNIKVQIGHSLADYDNCIKLMDKHAIGFTHLYNAMSGIDHHNPGVTIAALNRADYAEIICDLIHVSKANIYLAHKSIPGLYAISDSISATGMPDGNYDFSNFKIKKRHGIAMINGKTLAGSVINMHDTFKKLISINLSLQEAVAMTSYNPAKYLNEKKLGYIKKGFYSNLLILNNQFDIKEIYLYGKLIT
tara:strand:+ start:253 stop:1338 length:1086 start_codon:yes stop_codon:yes gene_type:complete